MAHVVIHNMFHTPSYLHRRNGLFYFRMRVPCPFQGQYGTEIRLSLQTGNKREAAHLSRALAVRYHAVFYNNKGEEMREKLGAIGTFEITTHPDGRIQSVKTEPNNPADLAAAMEAIKIMQGASSQQQIYQAPRQEVAPATTMLLSVAIEKFLAKMIPAGETGTKPQKVKGWDTEKAKIERPSHLGVLVELIGDLPLSTITANVLDEAWKNLQFLPPNWKKSKELKGKSISQVLLVQQERLTKYDAALARVSKQERYEINRDDFVKFLSASTCNNYAWTWGDFFEWCKRQKYVDENYASDFVIARDKSTSSRRAFRQDELKKLFESEYYERGQYDDAYKYWIPMLMLYSGGRLNEFCQLLTSDIVIEGGIPCILIIDDELNRQRLKNEASRRRIPVHSKLLDAGFMEFVEQMRDAGHIKLFPHLDTGGEKHSKLAGKWFNRHMTREGIKDGWGLDSHSFRHTAVSIWKNQETDERWAAAICGHTYKSDDDEEKLKKKAGTFSMYGGLIEPGTLKPYVEMLDYGLTHPPFKMPITEKRRLQKR